MTSKNLHLKHELMLLWKNTFGDSDEYVSLVFDNYYNPEMVEYEVADNRVVAALLGVSYTFCSQRIQRPLQGVYMCGLATCPEYRKKGIMGRLIERFCIRMKKRGMDFVFLIPADTSLAEYYAKRLFKPAVYKRHTSLKILATGDSDRCQSQSLLKPSQPSQYSEEFLAPLVKTEDDNIAVFRVDKNEFCAFKNVINHIEKHSIDVKKYNRLCEIINESYDINDALQYLKCYKHILQNNIQLFNNTNTDNKINVGTDALSKSKFNSNSDKNYNSNFCAAPKLSFDFNSNCNLDFNFVADKCELVFKIFRYINSSVCDNNSLILLHSLRDTLILLHENYISGGKVLVSTNNENNITGILIASSSDNCRFNVQYLKSNSENIRIKLLANLLKFAKSDSSISIQDDIPSCEYNVSVDEFYSRLQIACPSIKMNVPQESRLFSMYRPLNSEIQPQCFNSCTMSLLLE